MMVRVEDVALVAAATDNLIGWHDSSVRALGFTTRRTARWWTSPTPGPWIYFTAIQAEPAPTRAARQAARDELRAHLEDPDGGFEAVCVSFADLDLHADGLVPRTRGLWYARPSAPRPEPTPSGLDIVEVTDPTELAEFEQATSAAFGAPSPVAPFDVHARGVLDDPRMHVLIGRHHGEVVSGAMAYETGAVVGLYGVGTIPGHRHRGWARAITGAALALVPDRPAVLQPSPAAARMYRAMGFVEIGHFAHWG